MAGTAGTETTKPGRRIISLEVNWETQNALREWAQAAGFDLGWSFDGWPQASDYFDFHLTVIASTNKLDLPLGSRRIDKHELRATGFEVLGDNTPTLRIEADDWLKNMREFALSLGIDPTYPEFKPHVSLSYRWSGTPALETLPLPPFPLVFDWLVVAEVVDGPAKTADAATRAASISARFNDAATLAGTRKTKDGYLVADVRCARTGIQVYAGYEVGKPDMAEVKVYRPAAEVFSRDAMASYAFRPATVGHPPEGVTADNWRKEAVGTTGGDITRDGGFVRVPLLLMDAGAIETVAAGTREISMGYDCRLDWTPGTTPDGQAYDAVQRDLRMNHLAIVERGRAGAECRVGDGAPAHAENATEGKTTMAKHTVDGITYEMSDQGIELVSKLTAERKAANDRATAAEAALAEAVKARDAAAGEVAALKASAPTADALDAMAAERAACIDAARKLLPDLDTKGKGLGEIKAAVVKAKLGDATVAGKSADYISAAFDTLTAGVKVDPVADAMRGGLGGATVAADAVTKARDAYLSGMSNAWAGAAK